MGTRTQSLCLQRGNSERQSLGEAPALESLFSKSRGWRCLARSGVSGQGWGEKQVSQAGRKEPGDLKAAGPPGLLPHTACGDRIHGASAWKPEPWRGPARRRHPASARPFSQALLGQSVPLTGQPASPAQVTFPFPFPTGGQADGAVLQVPGCHAGSRQEDRGREACRCLPPPLALVLGPLRGGGWGLPQGCACSKGQAGWQRCQVFGRRPILACLGMSTASTDCRGGKCSLGACSLGWNECAAPVHGGGGGEDDQT